MAEIERHAFVLCVEGGGVDPAPKAWSVLLHGAIPIIRRTALAPAYAHLPVVMVDEWTTDRLTPERFVHWRDELVQWFDDPELRREVLYRLSSDYWWSLISAGKPMKIASGPAVG